MAETVFGYTLKTKGSPELRDKTPNGIKRRKLVMEANSELFYNFKALEHLVE